MPGKGAAPRPGILVALLCGLWLVSLDASQTPPFRSPFPQPPPPPGDFDLVLSYVTVTAARNATPPRLSVGDFHISEDNKEQKIDYFAVQNQPVSIGIVWGGGRGFDDPAPDPDVRECPRSFVRNSVPGSEFFLLSGDKVTTPYTTEPTRLPLNFAWSGASSDTIYIGLDVLKESANPRKILLVIAPPGEGGGGQLQSEYVEHVASRLSTQGAQATQVHVMSFVSDAREANHPAAIFLSELVDLTGGSYYFGPVSNTACANLARELRVQYLIGYHPTNAAKDGKWRKLNIKVDSPGNSPKLSARIKRGYYAAKASR